MPEDNEIREILFSLIDQSAWDLTGITQEQSNRLSLQLAKDRDEAEQRINDLILRGKIEERREVALDSYRGQTFSDSTNYKGKFEKFIRNNERRIAALEAQLSKEGE